MRGGAGRPQSRSTAPPPTTPARPRRPRRPTPRRTEHARGASTCASGSGHGNRLPLLQPAEPAQVDPGATTTAELAEQEVQDQPDDAESATADRNAPAYPAASTTAPAQVVDLRRVQLGVLVEPHAALPRRSHHI